MMKAGKYYVGDLCYVMDDKWDEFCALTTEGYNCLDGEFELGGIKVASYSTMYGDGEYSDQEGNKYPVDAGLIGCIRVEDIAPEELEKMEGSGNVFDFPDDFETSSENGVIVIGYVVIDTGDSGEEEDESDE